MEVNDQAGSEQAAAEQAAAEQAAAEQAVMASGAETVKEFHLAAVFMASTFNYEAGILEKKAAELRQKARAMSTIRDGLQAVLDAAAAQQKEPEGS